MLSMAGERITFAPERSAAPLRGGPKALSYGDMGQASRDPLWRCRPRASSSFGLWLVSFFFLAGAGCGGSNAGPPTDGGKTDADFAACASADAAPYMAGVTTASKSGAWVATIESVSTVSSFEPTVDSPAVGLSTFNVKLTDASGGAAVGLTMTADKPYMPAHRHSAPTVPVVMDQGAGSFVVSQIDFFMHGYFELTLNLQTSPEGDGGGDAAAPAADAGSAADGGSGGGSIPAAATDKIVLPICVPS